MLFKSKIHQATIFSFPVPTDRKAQWVEDLVRSNIIDNWQEQDEPIHLKSIRDRILYSGHLLLELYRQVLTQERVMAIVTVEEKELLLSELDQFFMKLQQIPKRERP